MAAVDKIRIGPNPIGSDRLTKLGLDLIAD